MKCEESCGSIFYLTPHTSHLTPHTSHQFIFCRTTALAFIRCHQLPLFYIKLLSFIHNPFVVTIFAQGIILCGGFAKIFELNNVGHTDAR